MLNRFYLFWPNCFFSFFFVIKVSEKNFFFIFEKKDSSIHCPVRLIDLKFFLFILFFPLSLSVSLPCTNLKMSRKKVLDNFFFGFTLFFSGLSQNDAKMSSPMFFSLAFHQYFSKKKNLKLEYIIKPHTLFLFYHHHHESSVSGFGRFFKKKISSLKNLDSIQFFFRSFFSIQPVTMFFILMHHQASIHLERLGHHLQFAL